MTIKNNLLQSVSISLIALIYAVITPVSIVLITQTSANAETTPTTVSCPSTNGTNVPTGSSASTFSWNPEKCVWENPYFTWDPFTKIQSPKFDTTPTLINSGTAWEYPNWVYVASSGKYVYRPTIEPIPQQPASTISAPAVSTPQELSKTSTPTSSSSVGTINTTGPNSNNNLTSQNNNNLNYNLNNTTNVLSTLNSNALTGNAKVLQNTNGGSARSGDANVLANQLTMLQSGWTPQSGNINTFNANLYGTMSGDVLFNPNSILTTGPNSNNTINENNNTDLNVVVNENASIINDFNLDATSGNAKVSENTNAGSATTGDATAIANLINMINSSINAQRSFIGNIAIHGALDGDLLLPPSVMALLQNTGANSNNNIAQNNNTNVNENISRNNSITNNLDVAAESGKAIVQANTNAGDAISGDARTNVTQQNIIGQNTRSLSGLLVFVNAVGNWTGSISPLFLQIADTGPDSNNSITQNNNLDADLELNQNYSITNNINTKAKSGDAIVTRNTNAGDARSGDASAAVNLLNMIDSNMVFDDWFGVLFINVFGDWNGSFGVDTDAGGKQSTKTPSNPTNSTVKSSVNAQLNSLASTVPPPTNSNALASATVQTRTSTHGNTGSETTNEEIEPVATSPTNSEDDQKVLGATTDDNTTTPTAATSSLGTLSNIAIPALAIGMLVLMFDQRTKLAGLIRR